MILINSGSTERIKISFSVPIYAAEETIPFEINVKSVSDKNLNSTEIVYLKVVRTTDVYIKDVKLDKYLVAPPGIVNIDANIANIGNTLTGKYDVETIIENSKGIVKRFDDSFESAPSSITLTNQYSIGKYDTPGRYNITAILKDSSGKVVGPNALSSFNVKVVNITPEDYAMKYTKRESSFNFFLITKSITIWNEGNVKSNNIPVSDSLSTFEKALFNPTVEPDRHESVDGRTVYTWLITLEPGDQKTITYTLDLWRIWVTIVVIGVAVWGSFKLFYKPTIIKKFRHQGPITRNKEIVVSLDVRNRTKHEIKNVEVRDVIPSIARLVEKFDTLRPRTRTTAVGTELRWKIESLKPREERVITYRIRPVVEVVGSLNLPKAHAKYLDRKKMKKIIASKSIFIKG